MILNRKTTKLFYILLSVLLFSAVVTWIDAVVHPSYFTKIPVKIIFFLLLPLSYFFLFREERPSLKRLFSFEAKGLGFSVLLGAALYLLILGAFFVARNLFDFTRVTESLTAGMGITSANFLFVALYISFFNSFLEEFFFRGFGFMVFKESLSGPVAYLFSPLCFAFYHGGMTVGMFHPVLFLLIFLGLFVGALLFNALNDRFGNLYPSWLVHMGADLAIMTVGALLFGLI